MLEIIRRIACRLCQSKPPCSICEHREANQPHPLTLFRTEPHDREDKQAIAREVEDTEDRARWLEINANVLGREGHNP